MLIAKNAWLYGLLKVEVLFTLMFSSEKSLKYCENNPEVVVDRGFWYKWALQRLGLKYRHETWLRNAVERFFFRLKERTKRLWNRFPFNSSFTSVQSRLDSFMAFYNYWRCLS
jgi:transposase-like protein